MSRCPKRCSISTCSEPRWKYSSYNMCEAHTVNADMRAEEEYEASPENVAISALEEVTNLDELKNFIREYLIEDRL